MVDIEEIYVTNLLKKRPNKSAYKGFYSFAKHTYQNDGEIVHDGFVIDKENLLILRAKIMAILIDELPINEKKTKSNSTYNKFKQMKLL